MYQIYAWKKSKFERNCMFLGYTLPHQPNNTNVMQYFSILIFCSCFCTQCVKFIQCQQKDQDFFYWNFVGKLASNLRLQCNSTGTRRQVSSFVPSFCHAQLLNPFISSTTLGASKTKRLITSSKSALENRYSTKCAMLSNTTFSFFFKGFQTDNF